MAKMETQSIRTAGTRPKAVDTRPRVGLKPTRPLKAAGTRPEPAVSVPSEKPTMPSATATAEPELEPPLMYFSSNAFFTAPYAERVPVRPVANWSRLVLPISTPPASRIFCTAVALFLGV